MTITKQVQNQKIAIVGMDVHVGACNGLDKFERSIYEGAQHFIIENELKPSGAYIQDFEIDTKRFHIPPKQVDKLNHQKLLMLKVADNALKDAGLNQGARLAVIIVTSKEDSLSSLQEKSHLEHISKLEASFNVIGSSKYHCNNENIIANCISSLWNFAGPSFTLTAEQNSVFKALEFAQKLLALQEVDAVLVGAVDLVGESNILQPEIVDAKVNAGANTLSYDQHANGCTIGEGAAAIVLKLHETAKRNKNRIYAVIDAISLVQKHSEIEVSEVSKTIAQTCQQAFCQAGITAENIGYLEVFGSGVQIQDESEIKGLIQAYRTFQSNLSCAIGSVKANIGHIYGASGLVSLVKTALCLYYRYIPSVPQWSKPKSLIGASWQDSPFYVVNESKPWFVEAGANKRIAAINSIEIDGSYAHVILSEETIQQERNNKYLQQTPFYLFAIAANNQSELLAQLCTLQETIIDCSSLSHAASHTFAAFKNSQNATYAVGIAGRNQDELTREIQRALKGIKDAFDTGKDWQTPTGSYFTPNPQGKQGKIAFVYPGAFNSYIGLARNLFRLFPQIYDNQLLKSVYNRVANIEKLVYPRSLNKLSKKQLETLEKQFMNDPVAMLECEIGIAGIITAILKDYFKIQPEYAFGYSLGETSMMYSQGVWDTLNQGSDDLNSSSLFKTQLSGPKNTVRKFWELPAQENESKEFWNCYILMCSPSRVKEALKHEHRVYLTLINTHNEVVIAGDTQACQRVIKALNCDAVSAPFNHVVHCEPVRSEYEQLLKMHTLPLENIPETVFYSSGEYEPMAFNSQVIGNNIAQALCQQVDFPRLVNRVYEDGARIFIETGVGSNCSRWIGETLKEKEHATVFLNKRSIDDSTSIIKALAKLVSHRVTLDLSPLYEDVEEKSKHNSMVKTIKFGNNQVDTTSFNENQDKCNNTPSSIPVINIDLEQYRIVDYQEFEQMNNFTESGINDLNNHSYPIINDNNQELLDLRNPLYQKLTENSERMTESHLAFLQARQESLQQISTIIQLQQALYQKLV